MNMTTVGCLYFGILTFLFCFHQALLSSVVLNAQPATFDPLTTEPFNVNCSYTHSNTSRVQFFISLFLSWTNDSTRPFKDLASINAFSIGRPVNVLTPDNVLASGEINIEGQSYVQLRWVLPNGGQVGFYKCSANGYDNVGHNVIESDVIEVKGKTPDMNQLLLAIRNLTFRQKETEETVEELKRNISSLANQLCNSTNIKPVTSTSPSTLTTSTSPSTRTTSTSPNTRTTSTSPSTRTTSTSPSTRTTSTSPSTRTTSTSPSTRTTSTSPSTRTTSTSPSTRTTSTSPSTRTTSTSPSILTTSTSPSALTWLSSNALNHMYSNQEVYYLSKQQYLNVSKAQEFCEIIGGYLIEIDDVAEYVSILPLLSLIQDRTAMAYTGGSEEQREGHWVFRTSGRPVAYFNWESGKDFPDTSHNCLTLFQEYNWKMLSSFCSNQNYVYYALCERSI